LEQKDENLIRLNGELDKKLDEINGIIKESGANTTDIYEKLKDAEDEYK
jgi:hypothetical protein